MGGSISELLSIRFALVGRGRGGRGSTPHGKPSGEQTLSRGHTAVVFSLL